MTVKEFEFLFDLKLLAFKEILNFLTNLSESNQVYIDSFDSDSHYVVSLIAPSNEGLKLAEVKNGGHCPLEMCYTILSFYDGNLWSDSSSDTGIKLFFSLPKIKNHE